VSAGAAGGAGGPAVEGPDYSPGFWLWHATLHWQRRVAAALEPLDLTHAQFVLLSCAWWLGERGELPNQQALARQAGTDVKMTSQLVRKLEAKGLLDREVDPLDTRARRLRVTEAGARTAGRAIAEVERVDAEFFGTAAGLGLGAGELAALLKRLAFPPEAAGTER